MKWQVWSDGSSLQVGKHSGPGGFCSIVICNDVVVDKLHGGSIDTTNNRMEIIGALRGVERTPLGSSVDVYSDSQYVVNTFNKRWIYRWLDNGFAGRANADLWRMFLKVIGNRNVKFHWVRGHNGERLNELADEIALREMRFYQEMRSAQDKISHTTTH